MRNDLRERVKALHAGQSGAVMLLLLAAFLILFMVSLVIYDAGEAAQDKMEAQIAADSASFSHAVVKARSMNMIVYANIIKRVLFSYTVAYTNAWIAIIAEFNERLAGCARLNIGDCIEVARALPMIVLEGIELGVTNNPNLGVVLAGPNARVKQELRALDRYQRYMFTITPWWAYVEGALRAMNNGAIASGSWPPPDNVVSSVKAKASRVFGAMGAASGGGVFGGAGDYTNNIDVLPVVRRDSQTLWSSSGDVFRFKVSGGTIAAAAGYYIDWLLSMEAVITGMQTYLKSQNAPRGWKGKFVGLQTIGSFGFAVAALAYNDDGYLDWVLKREIKESKDRWLQGTSNIHLAYRPRAGRNSDDEGRQKYGYMSQDHTGAGASPLYENEGYFAMSRAELVYKQPFEFLSAPFFTSSSFLAPKMGTQNEPDMWSPRWKARNRPIILPGEEFGSSVEGTAASLKTVLNDTIPMLTLGVLIGLPFNDEEYSGESGLDDMRYLLRATQNFQDERLEGIAK